MQHSPQLYNPWLPGAGPPPGLKRGIYTLKPTAGSCWDCQVTVSWSRWCGSRRTWWASGHTESETTMVKQCQSVLPGTPQLQNQGPPSDSSWYVEKIRTKQQLWDWSVLDTEIKRLSYHSASKFWGCPCPGPPHWAGLPSPPSQCNVPLLEKTSKSRGFFEDICCRDTSHLSWWPPSTQQRPSLFQASVENMVAGEEGVASSTTCPAGAPQLPQLLPALTGAASAPAELKSGARLEQQHCWGPAPTPQTGCAMPCPARRAVGWGRQAWPHWRPCLRPVVSSRSGKRQSWSRSTWDASHSSACFPFQGLLILKHTLASHLLRLSSAAPESHAGSQRCRAPLGSGSAPRTPVTCIPRGRAALWAFESLSNYAVVCS